MMPLDKHVGPDGQPSRDGMTGGSESIRRLANRTTSLFERLQILQELTPEDLRAVQQKMVEYFAKNSARLDPLREPGESEDRYRALLVRFLREISAEPFSGLLAREAVRLRVSLFPSTAHVVEGQEDGGIHPIVGDTWSVERPAPDRFRFASMGPAVPKGAAEAQASEDLPALTDLFSKYASKLSQVGADPAKFRQILAEAMDRFPEVRALRIPADAVSAREKEAINPDAPYYHEFPKGALIAKSVSVEGVPGYWVEYYSEAQLKKMEPPKMPAPMPVVKKQEGFLASIRSLLGGGK